MEWCWWAKRDIWCHKPGQETPRSQQACLTLTWTRSKATTRTSDKSRKWQPHRLNEKAGKRKKGRPDLTLRSAEGKWKALDNKVRTEHKSNTTSPSPQKTAWGLCAQQSKKCFNHRCYRKKQPLHLCILTQWNTHFNKSINKTNFTFICKWHIQYSLQLNDTMLLS